MILKPVMEIYQITAEYATAVVLAIMPFISDCSRALNLCDPCLVTTNQISSFGAKDRHGVGGTVILQSGDYFDFEDGHIELYDSGNSYFTLQNPEVSPRYFGVLRLDRAQAIQVAREFVEKLGYNLADVFMDQAPAKVEGPVKAKGKLIPYYKLTWLDPRSTGAEIEVNGESGKVERAWLFSPNFRRPPPLLPVKPRLAAATEKWHLDHGVSKEYAEKLLDRVLPEVEGFSKSLRLPVPHPIARESVAVVQCFKERNYIDFGSNWPTVVLEMRLADGSSFVYANGRVSEYHAPDRISFAWDMKLLPGQIVGEWRMTHREASIFVRDAIKALGYGVDDFGFKTEAVRIRKQEPIGKLVIPRYFLELNTGAPFCESMILAEIDADKRQFKSLRLKSRKLNRPLPDVGISP